MYRDGGYGHTHPDWHASDSSAKAEVLAQLIRDGGLCPNRVVEVGCGAGGVLAEVADRLRCSEALGVDPAPAAVERARGHVRPGLRFEVAEVAEVATGWDLVLCVDVVEHLKDDLGFLRSLRGLAPAAAFRIPLDDSIVDRMTGRTAGHALTYGHLHAYTRNIALERLTSAGFRVLLERYHQVPPRRPGRLTRLRRWGMRLCPHQTQRLLGGYSLVVLASTQ